MPKECPTCNPKMTDDKKPASRVECAHGKAQWDPCFECGNMWTPKPASAGRDWRDEVADNTEFWLLEDSGGQVRVIYDPPPAFFQMQTIHVVRSEALRKVEAERDEWKLKFDTEMAEAQGYCEEQDLQLTAANKRIAELESILSGKTFHDENAELRAEVERLQLLAHVTDESSYRAKAKRLIIFRDAAIAEVERYRSALENVRHSLGKLQNGSMFTSESELNLAIKYVDEALKGGADEK